MAKKSRYLFNVYKYVAVHKSDHQSVTLKKIPMVYLIFMLRRKTYYWFNLNNIKFGV